MSLNSNVSKTDVARTPSRLSVAIGSVVALEFVLAIIGYVVVYRALEAHSRWWIPLLVLGGVAILVALGMSWPDRQLAKIAKLRESGTAEDDDDGPSEPEYAQLSQLLAEVALELTRRPFLSVSRAYAVKAIPPLRIGGWNSFYASDLLWSTFGPDHLRCLFAHRVQYLRPEFLVTKFVFRCMKGGLFVYAAGMIFAENSRRIFDPAAAGSMESMIIASFGAVALWALLSLCMRLRWRFLEYRADQLALQYLQRHGQASVTTYDAAIERYERWLLYLPYALTPSGDRYTDNGPEPRKLDTRKRLLRRQAA